MIFVLAAILVLTSTPLNGYLLQTLEGRFSVPEATNDIDGILLLGADWQPHLTHLHGIASINNQPGRLVAFANLGRKNPNARMIVASGEVRRHGYPISDTLKTFMNEIGFPEERVEFVDRGRNTYETVEFAKQLAEPKPGEKWLMITSASHIARSVGVMRKLDWYALPFPTDFSGEPPAFDTINRLQILNGVMREWIGLIAYWLTDRTTEVYPGPGSK